MGDPNDGDDSLDAYTAFGVFYDKASDNWLYEGKPIHILYDVNRNTYCDNGNIEKLVEAEERELEQYVK